jgi:hypothetical protein
MRHLIDADVAVPVFGIPNNQEDSVQGSNERGADAPDAIQRILQDQVHRNTGEETNQNHCADALE